MAAATALPSPRAGPMQPKPVVTPAVMIETKAMRALLSMENPLRVKRFQ
jgi:hypothetical protein